MKPRRRLGQAASSHWDIN